MGGMDTLRQYIDHSHFVSITPYNMNKQAYQARKESAANHKMNQKERCSSMSDQQHDSLAEICTLRHNLHCSDGVGIFTGEGGEDKMISTINELISDFDQNYRITEFTEDDLTDVDWYDIFDEEDKSNYNYEFQEYRDHAIRLILNKIEKINTEIEKFLKKIDKEHHTEYCPSGFTRV